MWPNADKTQIRVIYRRKGTVETISKFSGAVYVIELAPGQTLADEDLKLTHIDRAQIGAELNLTGMPVVQIGGKSKYHGAKRAAFCKDNPNFQGAFLVLPGSGGWDMDDGYILLTNHDLLRPGARVRGEKPEDQWFNFRFLPDGRYVADWASVLHGKAIKTHKTEIEQDADAEKLVEWLSYSSREHFVAVRMREVSAELREIEKRRVQREGGKKNEKLWSAITECVRQKFEKMDVKRISQIPQSFSLTAAEVAPELAAMASIPQVLEFPGLGPVAIEEISDNLFYSTEQQATAQVTLSTAQLKQVTAWPYKHVWLNVLGYNVKWAYYDKIFRNEGNSWDEILKELVSRVEMIGKPNTDSINMVNCHENEAPELPKPILVHINPVTGERRFAYPYLNYRSGTGWQISWTYEPEDAERSDASARALAYTHFYTHKLLAELSANAEAVPEPLPDPIPVHIPPTFDREEVMSRLGLLPEQYRFEGSGPWGRVRYGASYFSELRGREVQIEPDFHYTIWWEKREEVIVIASNITIDELLKQMGGFAEAEKGAEVLAWVAQVRAEEVERYRQAVKSFAEALKDDEAFDCLPEDLRQQLEGFIENPPEPGDYRFRNVSEQIGAEWQKAIEAYYQEGEGEILTNFGGWFRERGKTGRCGYYVVGANGIDRLPTSYEGYKHSSAEGEKHWRVVGPEELAISWNKGHVYEQDTWEIKVDHVPVEGLTDAQRKRLAEIETELEVEIGTLSSKIK